MVDSRENRSGGMTRRGALGALASTLIARSRPSAAKTSQVFPRLRRGINIFHALNSPEVVQHGASVDYVWPPFTEPRHRLADADLHRLKDLGFDFVRLTVDPGILIAEEGAQRTFLERKVVEVASAVLCADLNVIVDLHPVRKNPAYDDYVLVSTEFSPVFEDYTNMVGRIAAALQPLPVDRVALELFNEPPLTKSADVSRWFTMLARLHQSARKAAPDLPLVLAGAKWDDRTTLMQLDLEAYRDSNVLFTFHYYDPHVFTHQGVESDGAAYVSGLDWPVRQLQALEILAQTERGIQEDPTVDANRKAVLSTSAEQLFSNVVKGGFDSSRIAADFAEVGEWAGTHGVSPERIILGEFGCVIQSHGRPLGTARFDWLETVRKTAEAHGFPWAYWAYKNYGGMELADGDGHLHFDLMGPLGLRP